MIRIPALLFFTVLISSCSNTKKVAAPPVEKRNTVATQPPRSVAFSVNEKQLFSKGIDFLATGTNGEWILTVNTEDSLKFESRDGLRLSTRSWTRKEAPDKSVVYTAQTKPFAINVVMSNIYCGSNSPERKVDISVGPKTYTGCAKFLGDENLQGRFNGSTGYMAFDQKKWTLKGNDGCNDFFGSYRVEGSRIRFGEFTFTIKNCRNKTIRKEISSYLANKLVPYKIVNNNLALYMINDGVLNFKK